MWCRIYLSICLWWPLGNNKQIVQNVFIVALYQTFFSHVYFNQSSYVYGESQRTKYVLYIYHNTVYGNSQGNIHLITPHHALNYSL